MTADVRKTLPFEVAQMANFEARMLRNFQAAIADWEEVCSALGTWEAQHLTKDDSTVASEQHQTWVTELLFGAGLMHQPTQQPESPDQNLAARVNPRFCHWEEKLPLWHR